MLEATSQAYQHWYFCIVFFSLFNLGWDKIHMISILDIMSINYWRSQKTCGANSTLILIIEYQIRTALERYKTQMWNEYDFFLYTIWILSSSRSNEFISRCLEYMVKSMVETFDTVDCQRINENRSQITFFVAIW